MAATSIANLSVRLTVQSKKFERRMQRASKRIKSFGKSIIRAAFSMKSLVVGMLAVAGARGLKTVITNTLDSIDALGKLSDILNITTQRLAALRFGAELAGASTDELDRALTILTRRLGEARIGAGEGVKGLKLLRLEADQLVRMNLDDAVGLISDRLRELPTSADQAAAAFTLFGRQGVSIANLLKLGSKEMRKFTEEVKRYGTAISRIDSARVEAANDSLFKVKQIFVGFATQIAIKLAPAIEMVSNKFIKWAIGATTVAAKVQEMYNLVISKSDVLADMFTEAQIVGLKFLEVIKAVPAAISQIFHANKFAFIHVRGFFNFVVLQAAKAAVTIADFYQDTMITPIATFYNTLPATIRAAVSGSVALMPTQIFDKEASLKTLDEIIESRMSKTKKADEEITAKMLANADRVLKVGDRAATLNEGRERRQLKNRERFNALIKDAERPSKAALALLGEANQGWDDIRITKEKIKQADFKQIKISRLFLRHAEKTLDVSKKQLKAKKQIGKNFHFGNPFVVPKSTGTFGEHPASTSRFRGETAALGSFERGARVQPGVNAARASGMSAKEKGGFERGQLSQIITLLEQGNINTGAKTASVVG